MSKETKKDQRSACSKGVQFVKYIEFAYRDKANVCTKIGRSQKGQILKSFMLPSVLLTKKEFNDKKRREDRRFSCQTSKQSHAVKISRIPNEVENDCS